MAGATKLMTAGGGGVNITPSSSIASDVTVNVPSQNCTLAIQGPAFSAYLSTTQSIALSTKTKIQLNTEAFDTNSCFDATTNFRFTPNVAGYYQINAMMYGNGTGASAYVVSIFKNSGEHKSSINFTSAGSNSLLVSDVVYMNGTTDYLELYGQVNATSAASVTGGSVVTFMSGCLVRAA